MRSDGLSAGVIVVTAILALWLPSSIDGAISTSLLAISIVGLCVSWLVLLVLQRGRVARLDLLLVLGVLGLPTVFTLTSPFLDITPGAFAVFLCLGLLLLVDLKRVTLPNWGAWVFVLLHVVTLGAGAALAVDAPGADAFFKRHYSAFYPQLLNWMLDWYDKPVLTFGTHSLAAFFYYLFFASCLVAWRRTRRVVFLGAAAAHLVLAWRLSSTAAFAFVGLALLQLYASVLVIAPRRVLLATLGLVLVAGVVVLPTVRADGALLDTIARALLGHEHAGFIARYGDAGVLAGNLRWLRDHPFEPVGFSYSPALFYGDSGIVVYAVRGTVLLPVMIYLAYFSFLWRNLRSRTVAGWLWGVTVLFEIGFTPLLYPRFLGFVPLLVLWCNWCEQYGTPAPKVTA